MLKTISGVACAVLLTSSIAMAQTATDQTTRGGASPNSPSVEKGAAPNKMMGNKMMSNNKMMGKKKMMKHHSKKKM